LIVADRVDLAPVATGGGQERGRRAGTENVAAIVGFGVAARIAAAELQDFTRLAELRDDMERRLRQAAPEARVLGADAPRLPNTTCIAMPGVKAETQVMALDLAGIAVSAGSACSSGKVRASHVLTAMGVDRHTADSAIRVSLGWPTQRAEIDRLVEAWVGIYRRLRGRQASPMPAA
jgi:cysteine desulfurase